MKWSSRKVERRGKRCSMVEEEIEKGKDSRRIVYRATWKRRRRRRRYKYRRKRM